MSKVKLYFDSKQKARHRQRRYETRQKKLNRARNCDAGLYPFYCGYTVEREKCQVTYGWLEMSGGRQVWYPVTKTQAKEVFIVKKITKEAKYLRNQAARKLRRYPCDEESIAMRGSLYKKDYDIQWALW